MRSGRLERGLLGQGSTHNRESPPKVRFQFSELSEGLC